MLKHGISANRNEHQNRKTEKSISKIADIAKPKIPMPPSWNLEVHYFLDYWESSSKPWKKLLPCQVAFRWQWKPRKELPTHKLSSLPSITHYLEDRLPIFPLNIGSNNDLSKDNCETKCGGRASRSEEDARIFKAIYCKCKPTAIQQANYTEKVLGNTRT